jgi:hypothetical protein
MMKRGWMLLWILVALIVFSRPVNASLTQIGTATYLGSNYNLIYEDDQKLIWLDYTNGGANWQSQMDWATGLNVSGVLAYDLNPGLNVTWSGDWRLPSTVDVITALGYNITTSEMGHLYYVSLGNLGYYDTTGTFQPGYGLTNKGPFNKLWTFYYWSGTELSLLRGNAYAFSFGSGHQGYGCEVGGYYDALAVRPGEVSAVPVPTSVLLLGSGLLGLVGFRRKFKK